MYRGGIYNFVQNKAARNGWMMVCEWDGVYVRAPVVSAPVVTLCVGECRSRGCPRVENVYPLTQ
jgi:hypothetical protein